jgi:hypothetical protein
VGKSARELDFLLARGGLSGPEKERVLGRVLDGVAPARPWWRRSWLGLGAGLGTAAAAAAVLVLTLRPGALPDRSAGLTPRGQESAQPALDLEVACSDGPLAACPQGSTLLFALRGSIPDGFLGAYAEPAGGGERIWYFSSEGEAPRVTAASGTQPQARGVRLGPEHAAGSYLVHVVLARRPLAKAELTAGTAPEVLATRELSLTVVSR